MVTMHSTNIIRAMHAGNYNDFKTKHMASSMQYIPVLQNLTLSLTIIIAGCHHLNQICGNMQLFILKINEIDVHGSPKFVAKVLINLNNVVVKTSHVGNLNK